MKLLILNANLVNEGQITQTDLLVEDGFIAQIGPNLSGRPADRVIDANGQYLLPGVIDDQVHFREPGLTHKANIHTESMAGVAGGTTTFMEMPNTVPNALTQELLQDKYDIAARTAMANYSFFMGASNDNLDEVLRTDPRTVCGIKAFMGSSTGNMLVDNEQVLDNLFRHSPMLIATHCEDEATVRANNERFKAEYGDHGTAALHPLIRDEVACLKSSSLAVELAKRHNTRLHILHISTAEELALFRNDIPLTEKRITAEVCVHHLWFDADDYEQLGNQIKCNPAIKAPHHRAELLKGLLDDRLDIIATDHAPHTRAEKAQSYWQAPSGLPLIQHSLLLMLDFVRQGKLDIQTVVRKMCHAPAQCFQIDRRGYVREGYWADLVLVDPNQTTSVTDESVYYHCGWTPLAGQTFTNAVTHTIVSGELVYERGQFLVERAGQRVLFAR
ncbi:dihydroorotase [Rudanella paleaurantiibacter]|uniref:Dihydroorotase n=1 Tax=Rudanella paleaurantiibacter TaxID=2614655 RepID=A0A7J5U520_9BACT|nr:dihydroorotase [Rudanella paleaurantiibacter]KAB7732934.1 dihydroorotase [Rudanella paleaurantiibacter]